MVGVLSTFMNTDILLVMSGTRKRHISTETSQIEDGLAILASMLADMLAGADGVGSVDATDDSQDEVEGTTSSQNHRAPVSDGSTTSDRGNRNL